MEFKYKALLLGKKPLIDPKKDLISGEKTLRAGEAAVSLNLTKVNNNQGSSSKGMTERSASKKFLAGVQHQHNY